MDSNAILRQLRGELRTDQLEVSDSIPGHVNLWWHDFYANISEFQGRYRVTVANLSKCVIDGRVDRYDFQEDADSEQDAVDRLADFLKRSLDSSADS